MDWKKQEMPQADQAVAIQGEALKEEDRGRTA